MDHFYFTEQNEFCFPYILAEKLPIFKFLCLPPVIMGVLWGVDTKTDSFWSRYKQNKIWSIKFFLTHFVYNLGLLASIGYQSK